jgi:uncharacterized protein YcaQ
MPVPSIERLRAHAISQSLFPETTLKTALRRLGFVQADPIRSPARAQDLILRHRVKGYRAGDLERRYAALDIEEDILYAYGFLPRTIWRVLHPRDTRSLSKLEKHVYQTVCRFGVMHPRELEAHLGSARVINAWGGYSKATTHALEHLHYRGLLRIARRENGVRLYQRAPAVAAGSSPAERLRTLILLIAGILAPVPEQSLHATITRYRYLGKPRAMVQDLLKAGLLERQQVAGVHYVWPHSRKPSGEVLQRVRFLAPFDPLVWDRRRFEHLWRWPYRFEAYTPPAKRVRGYYAMPLLWHDSVVGWANARMEGKHLKVDVGFAGSRPDEPAFRSELEAEIDRLQAFLQ